MKALGLFGFATEHAPTKAREAIDRRRMANMTGECVCGARMESVPIPGVAQHAPMVHESDCTASDDALRELGFKDEWAVDKWVVFDYPSGLILEIREHLPTTLKKVVG